MQGELEGALSRLLDRETRIDLAGRTDTGVHAVAQEVAFDAPAERTARDLERGLRALAPPDLGIVRLRAAEAGFHPRFDAEARRYQYVLWPGERAGSPFLRDRCWTPGWPADPGRLDELAESTLGERSFAGFAKSGQPERGTRCRVYAARWLRGPGPLLRFEIVADRFLHHMVRYLVGTSVEIAAARRPARDLGALLEGGGPSRPVFPAPPEGLYLTGVRYPEGWNRKVGLPWGATDAVD